MRFKPIRKCFIELIDFDFGENEVEFEDFSTQKSTLNGRPDLVISKDNIEIFIEIKVYDTNLTDNQPNGYLKELEGYEKENKLLILLIPNNYKHLDEYKGRLSSSSSPIKNQIICWSTFIDVLKKEEIIVGNSLFYEYYKMLKQWFEPSKISINYKFLKMINTVDFPKSIEELIKIVDQIKLEVQKSVQISSTKIKFEQEYGFYCEKENFYNLFIGEWFRYWKVTGNPLCISLESNNEEIKQVFKDELKKCKFFSEPNYFEDGVWLTSNILLDELVGEKEMLKIITEDLLRVIKKIESIN